MVMSIGLVFTQLTSITAFCAHSEYHLSENEALSTGPCLELAELQTRLSSERDRLRRELRNETGNSFSNAIFDQAISSLAWDFDQQLFFGGILTTYYDAPNSEIFVSPAISCDGGWVGFLKRGT